MTEQTAAARRPSPRPRPADAAPRPADQRPTLTVVPSPAEEPEPTDSAPGTLHPAPAEDTTPTIEFPQVKTNTDGAKADAVRFRVQSSWASMKAAAGRTGNYWMPPSIWSEQPASLAELADYARTAPWTTQHTGPIRAAGIWHYRCVAYPYTVVSRYREWAVQRPGRLLVHLGAIKLLAHTTPGIWVVDHIVYPAASLAGHVFL